MSAQVYRIGSCPACGPPRPSHQLESDFPAQANPNDSIRPDLALPSTGRGGSCRPRVYPAAVASCMTGRFSSVHRRRRQFDVAFFVQDFVATPMAPPCCRRPWRSCAISTQVGPKDAELCPNRFAVSSAHEDRLDRITLRAYSLRLAAPELHDASSGESGARVT